MSGLNAKLTVRGVVHDTLTLLLAFAVVFGVGLVGFEIGRAVERLVLVERGMCRMPPAVYPTTPETDGLKITLPWTRANVRL